MPFKYNSKKLEQESLINLKEYFISWEKTYTKLVTKDVIGYELNEYSFIKFISFINKYLNKIYKKTSNTISKFPLIENKSYLFGLIQKQVNIHKPMKTRWKIFGKEILRYKTKMI